MKRVEEKYQRASNAAKLVQLSQAALDALDGNDNSLLTQAGALGRTLQELRRVDAGADALVQLHGQAASALRELQSELSRYAEKVNVDPAQLQRSKNGSISSIRSSANTARRSPRSSRSATMRNADSRAWNSATANWRGSTGNCKNWMANCYVRAKTFPPNAAK